MGLLVVVFALVGAHNEATKNSKSEKKKILISLFLDVSGKG